MTSPIAITFLFLNTSKTLTFTVALLTKNYVCDAASMQLVNEQSASLKQIVICGCLFLFIIKLHKRLCVQSQSREQL